MNKQVFLKSAEFLWCPKCHAELCINTSGTHLKCKKDPSHRFPILKEGIPSFVTREEISPEDAKWVFEYDEMAEHYDEHVKEHNRWLEVNLHEEFRKVAERIPLKSSQRLLDVSVGTGAVLFTIKEVYPNIDLKLVGVDLSMGMLSVARRKFVGAGIEVLLFHTQVWELPFRDESFDIITHSGGINTFADIPAAFMEWVRVLRPEGTLFVADEGLSPTARKTRRGLQIVEENKLFGLQPPLEHLSPQLGNVELRWVAKDTFYTITCQKLSREELKRLETNGTEHLRIREMVETSLEKLRADKS